MNEVKAQKVEMTQVFQEDGQVVPVTIVKVTDEANPLRVGDVVTVRGVSKGKGFAGVVKRWSFAGGPKTHGQSDRWRAPGSIGAGTDPGRVWPGQKMPGRMGHTRITVKNLNIIEVRDDNLVLIKGAVPGPRHNELHILVTSTSTTEGAVENAS